MMSRIRVFCCSMILMLFPTLAGIAQDNSDLFTRMETLIAEKQPGWKLAKKRVYPKIEQGVYEWKKDKSSVAVHLFLYQSPEEASTRFKAMPLLYQGSGLDVRGLDMTLLRATVPKLGDENYLWEESRSQKSFGVDFRKGRVVVHTDASSIAVAEQFALQIAEAIPTFGTISRRLLTKPCAVCRVRGRRRGSERSVCAETAAVVPPD